MPHPAVTGKGWSIALKAQTSVTSPAGHGGDQLHFSHKLVVAGEISLFAQGSYEWGETRATAPCASLGLSLAR